MATKATISNIRDDMRLIKDSEISFVVKQNRGKTETYKGTLEGAYSNIFVMNVCVNDRQTNLAFNYSDIISGKVRFL